jgi:hypothetical protein
MHATTKSDDFPALSSKTFGTDGKEGDEKMGYMAQAHQPILARYIGATTASKERKVYIYIYIYIK